jgi:hypothetical protein
LLGFASEHVSFPEKILPKPVGLMDFENEKQVNQSSTPSRMRQNVKNSLKLCGFGDLIFLQSS